MNGRPRHNFAKSRRRGSIYAMVLGVTMLITVIGVGALMASRVTTRSVGVSTDWEDAGAIAFSAIEHAIAKLNGEAAASPDTWRDAYTSGTVGFSGSFGRGTMKWALIDEADGVFNNDYGDAIRVYGVGIIGKTKRVYSVQLNASGDGLEALRCAFHSASGVSLGATTVVLGGPASTNGNFSNAGFLVGGAGTEVAGTGGTSSAVKKMPAAGVFNIYKAKATTIASSHASSGTIWPGTLSAANNPYGPENADGIYYLKLPATIGTLNISSCRLKGTLLIEAATGNTQTLTINAPMSWEPHHSGYATLITKNIAVVSVNGSTSQYTDGNSDPASELRGLFHTIGSSSVVFNAASFVRGCWIAEGSISTNAVVGFTATPSLKTTPPLGYNKGNKLTPVGGTWKWDAPPTGVSLGS